MAERRAEKAEKQNVELTVALIAMMDGIVIKDFKAQIAKAEKQMADVRSADEGLRL